MTKEEARDALKNDRKLTSDIATALGLPAALVAAMESGTMSSEDYNTVIDKLIASF